MKTSLAVLALLFLTGTAFSQDTKTPTVNIVREVKKHNAGEYEVKITLTCTDGTVGGYARYKESISPENTHAQVSLLNSGSASLTFADNTVKFLWTSISLKDPVVISYLVKDADVIASDLPGTFTFVSGENKVAAELQQKNMLYSEGK